MVRTRKASFVWCGDVCVLQCCRSIGNWTWLGDGGRTDRDIMAILGGALLTPLQAVVSDATNIYISYLVPLGCFVVVGAFAFYSIKVSKK